jgi:O-antigen/teichoic acid export membrane protein
MVSKHRSKPKSFISNSIWSISSTLWSTIVTFFLTPFLINRIGVEHYGIYMLLMSIAGMMGILNLGLGEATLRFVARYYVLRDSDGINRVVGSTLLVYSLMGLLGGTLLFLFAPKICLLLSIPVNDQQLTISIIKLTAFNFGFSFIIGVFSSIPAAVLRFDISTKVSILQNIFQVVGTVILLLSGYGLYSIVLWSVLSILFIQITNMIIAKRLLPDLCLFPVFSIKGLKEVFSYGVFSSINDVIALLSSHIDRILLAAFVNPMAVAALTVPKQILERASSLLQSSGAVLFPKISSMSNLDDIRRIYQISSWGLLTLSMAMFTPGIILLPEFISLWINPQFAKSSGIVAQLLSAAFAFRGISEPYFAVLKGMNKIKYLTVIFLSTNLISILLAIPLLYYYSVEGAGFRALLLVWVSIPISFWINTRFLKDKQQRKYYRLIIYSILISSFVTILGYFVNKFFTPKSLPTLLLLWVMMSFLILTIAYYVQQYFYKDLSQNLEILISYKNAIRKVFRCKNRV